MNLKLSIFQICSGRNISSSWKILNEKWIVICAHGQTDFDFPFLNQLNYILSDFWKKKYEVLYQLFELKMIYYEVFSFIQIQAIFLFNLKLGAFQAWLCTAIFTSFCSRILSKVSCKKMTSKVLNHGEYKLTKNDTKTWLSKKGSNQKKLQRFFYYFPIIIFKPNAYSYIEI